MQEGDPFNVQAGFTASRPRFQPRSLTKVLIANRGEIALRLIRTCKALHLETVAVYSTADEGAPHTFAADSAVLLPGKEAEGGGYLDKEAIVKACKDHEANVVLPGYGFLSENEDFAALLEGAGIVLCGPRSETMRAFGLKHEARELAAKAGVPCVPGTGLLPNAEEALSAAGEIGYPIMLKSSAGGGGMGLQVCRDADGLKAAYDTVTSRGKALFGNAQVFMEKYIEKGRHIEVQIFGNGLGDCISFNERECSIQRRHQKVIEEAPSAFVSKMKGLRKRLTDAATSLGSSIKYRSAGTVEMLVNDETGEFYFLETNVRLQVEHPVTELTHDVDLVALMLLQADRELSGQGGIAADELKQLVGEPQGWAVEARLYAEDPVRGYAPSPGKIQNLKWLGAPGTRIDGWIKTGSNVSPSYDPLLAKVIGHGKTREEACHSLSSLLRESAVQGPPTNQELLEQIVASKAFRHGHTLTSFLTSGEDFRYEPLAVEVLEAGLSTSVQAYPGRRGVLHGVPEAGPLDALSLRIANLIVGNDEHVEGLEVTMAGPTLLFHSDAVIAIVGADMHLELDGREVGNWSRLAISKGSTLVVGGTKESAAGSRAYIAIRGGLPGVAEWLGSKATCAAIGVGGFQGRNLLPGDTLRLPGLDSLPSTSIEVPPELRWNHELKKGSWQLLAMPGPFDDDEFVSVAGREQLWNNTFTVSPQAARTGTRFDTSRLKWGREDGGEGGAHPSNVLEYGYSPQGINWNGDTPVLFHSDCPDLGGLAITHCVISSDWRAGQLTPGDKITFKAVSFQTAQALVERQDEYLAGISAFVQSGDTSHLRPLDFDVTELEKQKPAPPHGLLRVIEASTSRPRVEFRAGGDRTLVICYGPHAADIVNRARIQLLQQSLEKGAADEGMIAFSPNVRSLTIWFDPKRTDFDTLIDLSTKIDDSLPPPAEVELQVRLWEMPVTMDDPLVTMAVQRYKETVRSKAIYNEGDGDNKPYIARCNGLSSIDDVTKAIFGTTFVVVGSGFYCATPILQPLDPRARLMCMKLNPTRLYTPFGALGLGGSMAAIYGVSSAGGYNLIGRSLPGWREYGDIPPFSPDRPWMLSEFDFVKFVPVPQEEYEATLASFLAGTYKFKVGSTTFNVKSQMDFLDGVKEEAVEFQQRQKIAMEECRQEEERLFGEWQREEEDKNKAKAASAGSGGGGGVGDDDGHDWANDPEAVLLKATLAGSVWKVSVDKGQKMEKGDVAVVLEAMKTEITIRAPKPFTVKAVLQAPGSAVKPGDVLVAGKQE